jgi:nucleoside-diphosphate-sugar epimerase
MINQNATGCSIAGWRGAIDLPHGEVRMLALVTGGAGFIGSHIVDALVEDGADVRVLDNLVAGRESGFRHGRYVELIRGDIRDSHTVSQAIRDVEVVFHHAALPSVQGSIEDVGSCHDVNVTGTLNVLTAARDAHVRRVVFASSSAVYGDGPEVPKREAMCPIPLSPYAAAKLTGEHYCRIFYQHYGLETVALRYFNVFGPRQNPKSEYAAVIPRFLTMMLAGEQPVVFGDGEQTRDFVAVQNVVTANLQASRSPAAPGRAYNIGCGVQTSLNQLLGHIAALTGNPARPRHLPWKPGDIRHSVADITAARYDLGYEPRVSIQDGLAMLLEQYRVPAAA